MAITTQAIKGVVLAGCAAGVIGGSLGPVRMLAAVPATPQGQVTFTKDVAPILQRSCQSCHRPGSIAPMSLITYEDVRPWTRAIKLKTSLREMPPWFIEKNVGIQKFKDDISLSDEEIATIAAWSDGGAARGNPSDMPPPRQFPDSDTWTIGPPDLIVSSPVQTLEAVAADFYGVLESSPTGLTEDRYIKAVEIKEVRLQGNARATGRVAGDLDLFVVHHAVVSGGRRLPEDVISRIGGFGRGTARPAPSARRSDAGATFSITYNVGQNATIYPDDFGVILSAGSSLNFDVHLHSIGIEVPFRIDVGFKFHPKGYKPKYTETFILGAGRQASYDLDIPAGEVTRIDGFHTVPYPVLMANFEPHLHSSGARICAEAAYPNGVTEVLNCAGYNHNWVKTYAYDEDVAPLLPAGTVIHLIGWFDNTAKNPRVVDSRNWQGYGNRSIDNMFALTSMFLRLTQEQFDAEVAARRTKQRSRSNTTIARSNG